jgi:hypothetical protein
VSFVLGNSVALTWCFEDERTPATTALLERVAESGALAPRLWPLDAMNGLLVAERRGRLDDKSGMDRDDGSGRALCSLRL